MNIELEIKDIKHDLNYAKNCEYDHVTLDVYKVQALLTAYEKEKETSHYVQSQLDIANAKLVEEKEKNKELIKERATEIVYVDKNFIRKDKIKPIQIIDLDGKIHNVYKIEEE